MTHRGNSKKTPGIRLQDRDFGVLRDLGTVLWMGTPLINERHFPIDKTGESTRRRLRVLAAHEMIESFDLHVTARKDEGRMPRYHRLLPYGGELLTEFTGESPARMLRSSPPKPHTIQHRAGMGEVVLKFNDACRLKQLPKSQWLLEYDAIRGASPKSPFDERYEICYAVIDNAGNKLRVWPDALSSLNVPNDGTISQLALAWEYDRGTETQTQLLDKLNPYALWIASKAYRQHFPSAVNVRVCFVLQSERRLKSTIDGINGHAAASFLRFVTVGDFHADRILTAPVWRDANGQPKRMLPS